MFRNCAWFALALVLAPQQRPPSDVGGAPAAVVLFQTPVDATRARNQRCFEEQYLALKERLFEHHAGDWVAIVEGELLPREGEHVAPRETLEELLAALAGSPTAPAHRFVWRIGEEGLVRHQFTLCDRPVFAGHALFVELGKVWILPDSVVQGNPDGEHRRLGSGSEPVLDLELVAPDGSKNVATQAFAANLYGGTLVLDRDSAARVGLANWEIPGVAEMVGVASMVRARLRVRVPAAGFERLLPVAVRMP